MAETDDLSGVLPRFAAKAEAMRASGLSGLEGVARARQAGLEREHRRVSEKLGADHPRARALAARIESGATRLVDLKMEIVRAGQDVHQVSTNEWMLYGVVWQKDLSPAPDLTVALVDANGKWIEALGFACTDARGHFQLVVSVPSEQRGAETDAAAEPAAPAQQQAYVQVTDRDHRQLYRSEDPVAVSAGETEYREIVLADDIGCVPPEEGVAPRPRKSATARRKRKE